MSTIPSMADSTLNALRNGWSQMDRAAAEIVSATTDSPTMPQDVVDIRSGGTPPDLIAGMRDMMLARQQVSAGNFLLRTYRQNSEALLEMTKSDSH